MVLRSTVLAASWVAPLGLLASGAVRGSESSCAHLGCGQKDDACSCEDSCTQLVICCSDYAPVCRGSAPHLQFGDVNLAVTTDMHSWLDGWPHVSYLNATLAHTVSMVEELRRLAAVQRRDVFFFDNGDINDGTGLSGTAQDHVDYLAPIMLSANYDALGIGNHELYQLNSRETSIGKACAVVGLRDSGYIAAWGGRYLTSNVVWAASGAPVGNRFALLTGKFGTRLLVFSFLYNMPDHCDAVRVEDVNATVHSDWFTRAVREHGISSDAVVVLAHMDFRDELLDVILNGIRVLLGLEKPVQFLTGHSHVRGWRRLDNLSSSFEAGCKMDTVGFTSFSKKSSGSHAPLDFFFADINGNTAEMARAANSSAPELLLPAGEAAAVALRHARAVLHLGEVLGCARRHYKNWTPLDQEDSLWTFYTKSVLPAVLFEGHGRPQWAVVGSGALTFDIFEGTVTKNDIYTTSPFGNFWFVLPGIAGVDLQRLLGHLNPSCGSSCSDAAAGRRLGFGPEPPVPAYVATGVPEENIVYDVIYCDFDAATVEGLLAEIRGSPLPNRSWYRPGSNTSSVLEDWFRTQPCPPAGPTFV